ncbi:LacI family DNA-binding transcriptional regulator [Cohnella sp. JJ-181]|uniref:LacI family DNA-binding transcriptional regulator n=1 Tax=Cohnella rhizoplanae TaxID=2974897 RepID=UPI00232DC4B6|nr:LacI family DNA-binding transcriptional regulator [Cohnella sp. JJ-181]
MTMQQIAERVGVSKFAVSQALSGKPGVAEETRNRILQAANELGYDSKGKSREAAPGPRRSRGRGKGRGASAYKGTVVILMPNVRFQSRESHFWGRIVDGVAVALSERDIGVLMVTENYSERSLKSINPQALLGLVGVGYMSTQLLLEVRHLGIPSVLIDHEDPLVPADSVFMNNFEAVRAMTELVLQTGRTRLRFVGNPRYASSFRDRWLGFRTVLEDARLEVPDPESDPLMRLEEQHPHLTVDLVVDELCARGELPSAFVCANDFMGYLILKALARNGVNVPGQVAVTGFDHTDEGVDASLPALSTVHVPREGLGRRAVEMLFTRLADPDRPVEKTLIGGALLLRESFRSE